MYWSIYWCLTYTHRVLEYILVIAVVFPDPEDVHDRDGDRGQSNDDDRRQSNDDADDETTRPNTRPQSPPDEVPGKYVQYPCYGFNFVDTLAQIVQI